MHRVPLVTSILLCSFSVLSYLLKCRVILPVRHIQVVLKSETVSLWQLQSALLHSRWLVNFKGKYCISHMPQRLARRDECAENYCKRIRHFLIVHTEHGQWQASFTWEKLACLTEVSVIEQISMRMPINRGLSMRKHYVPGSFFSAHA